MAKFPDLAKPQNKSSFININAFPHCHTPREEHLARELWLFKICRKWAARKVPILPMSLPNAKWEMTGGAVYAHLSPFLCVLFLFIHSTFYIWKHVKRPTKGGWQSATTITTDNKSQSWDGIGGTPSLPVARQPIKKSHNSFPFRGHSHPALSNLGLANLLLAVTPIRLSHNRGKDKRELISVFAANRKKRTQKEHSSEPRQFCGY